MPQVQRIDPIALPSEKESVAAYCRVSTDSADQLNSYHSQIAYYTKLINDNPDWELYDLYADAGITGTSIDKRDEFKRMLADCREGKIQRVLVKSVSRFARNTTELLETTRELKDLGVVVVFEEQGFDTYQVLGEMQLTMYAMAAQEESHSISKNMIWSYQKSFPTSGHGGQKSSEDKSISIYDCAEFATRPGTGEHPRPPTAPAVIAPQYCEAPPQVHGRA